MTTRLTLLATLAALGTACAVVACGSDDTGASRPAADASILDAAGHPDATSADDGQAGDASLSLPDGSAGDSTVAGDADDADASSLFDATPACDGGACLISLTSHALAYPFAYAVDDAKVYFGNYASTTKRDLDAVTLDGGTVTVLEPGLPILSGAAVDGTDLYWATLAGPTAVGKATLDGGVPVALSDAGNASGIAIDAENVYFTDPTGNVWQVGIDGGPVISIAKNQATPGAIAVDDTDVFWANQSTTAGAVMTAPKGGFTDGGAPAVVADGLSAPDTIALGTDRVYWGSNDGTVRSAPLAGPFHGGAGTLVASQPGEAVVSIAVDGTTLYYAVTPRDQAQTTLTGGILVVALTTGQSWPLVWNVDQPVGLLFDTNNVYWSTQTSPGAVYRIAK